MSVQSEIQRIDKNVKDTLQTIADTGVAVGAGSNALPAAAAALANKKADVEHTHTLEQLPLGNAVFLVSEDDIELEIGGDDMMKTMAINATMKCNSSVREGDLVQIVGGYVVGASVDGGKFHGYVNEVSSNRLECNVTLAGIVTVPYTGEAPAVGMSVLCANGTGGVKVSNHGASYLVANVDAENGLVTILMTSGGVEGDGAYVTRTMACENVVAGQVVQITNKNTVGGCTDGGRVQGVVESVSADGTECNVILFGMVEIPYTGVAPNVGYVALSANATGGVRVDPMGRQRVVVDVDESAKTVSFIMNT